MKALIISGTVRLAEISKDIRVIEHALHCAKGCAETIWLHDPEAVLVADREAMQHGAPYNSIASLIAGTGIYGTAVIMGDGADDVPAAYLDMLEEINA